MEVTRRRLLGVLGATAGAGVVGYALDDGRGSVLRFGDGVDADTRARCRRVERRIGDLVGRRLDAPVHVRFVDPGAGDVAGASDATGRFASAVAAAQAIDGVTWPSSVPARLARYDGSTRTVSFLDPEELDLSRIADRYDVVLPDGDWYPHDPLVAHELTHALQDGLVGTIDPADATRDAAAACETVVEGTADYVAGLYRAACRDGRYDDYRLGPGGRLHPDAPLFVVAGDRPRYVNGRVFAHELVREAGWDALWRAHRSPPATTAAITYPTRFRKGGSTPVEPALAATGADWLPIGRDRLGVEGLYTLLYALGQVSLDDEAAQVDPDVTAATTFRYAFRTTLLRDWLGDRLAAYGYVDDLDRFGYEWRTVWRSPTAAARVAAAVRDGFAARGRSVDDGWRVADRVVWVERRDDGVSVRAAPDRAAVGDLFASGDVPEHRPAGRRR
ncbi:hypothetical protein [Haloarchaeobius iranensis]|uniref:Uncharacterized protein n=1 Tax=Haloarchaeobius iranensis TaxID=996166 RepID=A0A1H0A7W0_9EURY|nr:hypothetical protein [Haloarchaeobius iranensis]SDN29620.1 hypothetical protein SAMN05192554_12532 [Haloarchaeobius iranensis]